VNNPQETYFGDSFPVCRECANPIFSDNIAGNHQQEGKKNDQISQNLEFYLVFAFLT